MTTPAGQALFDMVGEIAQTFFRLRAAGARVGAVTNWGGGLWGFLRSLALEGPQTVPQIARARPVSRQRMQRLANDLAADGLVEFIDNPAHRKSKLVRLTPKGEAAFEEISGRIAQWTGRLARDMDAVELRAAARVLRQIRQRVEAP